jgi:hypothetical protein
MDVGLDYGEIPEWAQAVRQLPLGFVPFLTYQVKTAGYTAGKLITSRPLTAQALMHTTQASERQDMDDPAMNAARQLANGWERDRLIPYAGGTKVRYVRSENPLGLGPLTELGKGGSDVSPEVSEMRPGGPLATAMAIAMNRDFFTGREVRTPWKSGWEQLAQVSKYAVAQMGPGTISVILLKLLPARAGDSDNRGIDRSEAQAWAAVMGLKLRDAQQQEQMARFAGVLHNVEKEILADFRKKRLKGQFKTDEAYQAAVVSALQDAIDASVLRFRRAIAAGERMGLKAPLEEQPPMR